MLVVISNQIILVGSQYRYLIPDIIICMILLIYSYINFRKWYVFKNIYLIIYTRCHMLILHVTFLNKN